jgi:hypothetical protein
MTAKDLIDDLCAGLLSDPELWITSRLICNPEAPDLARAAAVMRAAMMHLRAELERGRQ